MMNDDDMELVREYAARQSEPAFETLVSRYVNLVYSSALRQVRDPHLAEEITQAVFIILARKAGQLGSQTILPSWLHRTAVFVAADALKSQRRRAQRDQEAHMQSLLNEPDTETWQQIAPLLDSAIAGLAEKDRHAIVLRFFQNKSLNEVGAALGASEGAAKKRVNRALEKLRQFFTKRGVVSTTAIIAGMISTSAVQAAPPALAKSVTSVALAKGAAAAGSTLILVKGALKLMTWTKIKTAMVTVTIVLLAGTAGLVATRTVHAVRAAHAPDLQGAWEGVMLLDEAGVAAGESASTHVVLKLAKSNGVYYATTDWMELGRKDVPMGRVVYDYPALQLEWNPRNTWKLKVNADGTQLVLDYYLHFIQPAPVVLTRTATPNSVPERLASGDFAPRIGSELQGYWYGEVTIGPDIEPVNLKIAEQPDGTFRAEGDGPRKGIQGQPVLVTYTRPMVKLAVASGSGMFQGKLNGANTEITGSWIQGGQELPARFKRTDYAAEHAQDMLKSYAYISDTELQGHWKGSWVVKMEKVEASIRYALDIAKLPDGTYSATLANLDQFGFDAPVPASEFQCALPNVSLKWQGSGTAYVGSLKNGKLVGTWQQGGGGFPLIFERDKSQ